MSEIRQHRKKPVVIDDMQWDGTTADATTVINWVLNNGGTARFVGEGESHPLRKTIELQRIGNYSEVRDLAPAFIVIDSLEGPHRMDAHDIMIRGVQGEFYACKPDIFAETYDPAPSTVKPDPEMVDLIGAHVWWPQLDLRSSECACGWRGEDPEYPSVGHAAHVALVVEQHTNGRIAELEARIANAQSLCNATGRYNAARQKHWNIRVFACDVLAALKGRAALEGEQQ